MIWCTFCVIHVLRWRFVKLCTCIYNTCITLVSKLSKWQMILPKMKLNSLANDFTMLCYENIDFFPNFPWWVSVPMLFLWEIRLQRHESRISKMAATQLSKVFDWHMLMSDVRITWSPYWNVIGQCKEVSLGGVAGHFNALPGGNLAPLHIIDVQTNRHIYKVIPPLSSRNIFMECRSSWKRSWTW